MTGAASREAAAGRQTSTGWLTQRVGGGEDRTARFGAQVCIDIDFPSPTPPKTERTGESWNCRTMHRKEAIKTVYREVGGECKDGSTIGIDMNSHNTSVKECLSKTEVVTTDSCPDRVIIPDPTPKRVNSVFYDILPKLMPILQKDNVQDFLRFFHRNMDVMGRDLVTPETFFYIIMVNSVRCAKVVLEGQAPELEGLRAYPNCVT